MGIDVAEWVPPGKEMKVKFILLMDMATRLRAVQPLFSYDFLQMKAESSEQVIQALSERWLSVFPKPQLLVLDSAKTFISRQFHDFASSINLELHYVAEKEHWAHGLVEAATQDVKHTASAIHLESLDQSPEVSLQLAVAALNSTKYTAGFSSFQWAYGTSYNITDEDVRTYPGLPPDAISDFGRLASARQAAEEVARKTRATRVLSKLANSSVT